MAAFMDEVSDSEEFDLEDEDSNNLMMCCCKKNLLHNEDLKF